MYIKILQLVHATLVPKNDCVFLDLRPSVLLPIRPTSTWFYSCQMDFWPQRPAPQPVLAAALGPLARPSRSARPRNCLNLTKPSNNTKINSCRRSDVAVGRMGSRADGQQDGWAVERINITNVFNVVTKLKVLPVALNLK